MRQFNTVLFFITCLLLSSCSSETKTPTTGRVAILDVQRVAKESGYARQINRQLEELKNQLQTQITGVQTQLNSQLNDKQIVFGKKPNDEQVKELNQLFASAKLQLQNAQQEAHDVIQKERTHLTNQLFDILRPYAKRIANDRSLDIVMLKSDLLVFDHSPETDITNEVIAAVVDAKADLVLKPAHPETPPREASKDTNASENSTAQSKQ